MQYFLILHFLNNFLKLWERAQPIPENVNNILADAHKNIHKRQKLLRISSLLCLQNFCNCMTIDDLGGSKALYDVWLDLGQQIFQTNQDSETTAALSSLMRATLEHLKTSPALFEQVADHDLQLILDGVRDCSHSEITANWLKMLGTLGCLLKEPMVKKITDFILEVALKETDVWTMSEALDSFMDMFSDNDWNQIVYDLNVVSKSRELEKILKTKVSTSMKFNYSFILSNFIFQFLGTTTKARVRRSLYNNNYS